MEAASLAIRRSGARLRSMSGRHTELRLLISELRSLRAAQRGLAAAQGRAAQQLLRWARRDENHAVQETARWLSELSALHAEAQAQFSAQLKALRYQFEMMLEGEERLDACRQQLASCETRAAKHRRELKRAPPTERAPAEAKLLTSERATVAAQQEAAERAREHEVAKVTRLKQGLLSFSDGWLLFSERERLVAAAQRGIAEELPDLDAAQLHAASYSGSQRCEQAVGRVRELLRAPSPPRGPPPPYPASPDAVTPPRCCRTCGATRWSGWPDSPHSSGGDFSPSAPAASTSYLSGSGGYPSPDRQMAALQLR